MLVKTGPAMSLHQAWNSSACAISGEATSTHGIPTTSTACCLSSTDTSRPARSAGVGVRTGGIPALIPPRRFSRRGRTSSFLTSPEMHITALEAQMMRSYCSFTSRTVSEERLSGVPDGEFP